MQKIDLTYKHRRPVCEQKGRFMLHRNSQKRIYGKNKIYFNTFYPKNRIHFFQEEIFCQIFFNVLFLSKKFHNFEFYGLVILYEHLHILIKPISCDVSKLMAFIKRHSSRYINELIEANFNRKYESGPGEARQIPGGHSDVRLQKRLKNKTPEQKQAILWMEEKMNDYKCIYQKKYPSQFHQKFKWQEGFRDHIIRNRKDFDIKLGYIKKNPKKHRLVLSENNWPWLYIRK